MLGKYIIRSITLFILFTFLTPQESRATHIVGGEMTYTCLGNDLYEIKLTIFRDCFNGNPNAFFDDPAYIGIYNSTGALIDSLAIPFDPILNDTLNPILSDSCLVVPPNVCVHTTQYTGTKVLPNIPGGYRLLHQRCCRNMTIANIVDPLDTGATFGVDISERALEECNSSALFTQWPPIYICVNEPIIFDQSAIDADGDSIVYRLCTPIDGATPAVPYPEPYEQTIPQEVVWVDPPYNLDNVLGGVPLAIDLNTGLLTGTPNTIGQFVVGICLEEYRNGELISTTRRDFQYNVGQCGTATASFFAPVLNCDGLTVDFNNESLNADEYKWFFNDPAYPDSCSTEVSPTYTFSDTGTYNVVLIAEPGNTCEDSFMLPVSVYNPSLFAEFDFEYVNCTDSLIIEVTDLSYDTIFDVVAWDWELNDGTNVIATSDEPDPTFILTTSTTVFLELVVTASNGCTQQLTTAFAANIFTEETFPDEVVICFDQSVNLNPDPFPGVQYTWSPPEGLDNPGSPSPNASPDTTTTYVVFIESLVGQCELFDTVTVVVDSIDAAFTLDVPCDLEVFFENASYNAQNYTWLFNDPGNPGAMSNEENPIFTYSAPGNYTATLIADNGELCADTSFLIFTIEEPDIQPDFEFAVLSCVDSFSVDLTDLTTHAAGLTFGWDWYIYENNELIDSFDIQNPVLTVYSTSEYIIELVITDSEGCTATVQDTILAQVFSAGLIPDGTLFCPGDSALLNPNPFVDVDYVWSPGDGLSDPNSDSPWAFPDMGMTYFVTATDQFGCMFMDTVEVLLDSLDASFVADVPCDFEVIFTNTSYNAENSIWFFNDPNNSGAMSMETNPTFVYSDTGTFTATLIIESGINCTDSASVDFFIDDPELLPDFDFDVPNCTDSFTVVLNDNSTHLGGLTFDWTWIVSEGSTVLDTLFGENPEFTVYSTSNYEIELIITDSEGCTSSTIQNIPAQVFVEGAIPDVSLVCPQDSVLLNPDPIPGVSYSWSPSDGLSDPNTASPMALPDQSTTYEVTVEDQFGCTFTDEVFFEIVETEPLLDGFILPDTIFEGDTAQIFTTQNPNYIYQWEFDESLSDLTIPDPLAYPLETTTYTLSITNDDNCTNTIQLLLVVVPRVCDEPNLFLPNAFTPNGDGENDVLRLMGNGIDEMHLVIYNRWGQKVFESFDQSIGWDGTFKGEKLPPDAYGFYLRALCFNQEEYYKQGNITLLR